MHKDAILVEFTPNSYRNVNMFRNLAYYRGIKYIKYFAETVKRVNNKLVVAITNRRMKI